MILKLVIMNGGNMINKEKSIAGLDTKKCLSCRSCFLTCPKNAIEMRENREGFFYPIINEKCINCGLCVTHCPILTPNKKPFFGQRIFCLILKNEELLRKSSSGGVFAGIANYILSENGVVYGCAYDENFNANIIGITNVADLYKLQGSKYVASNTNVTYKQVKENLEIGKKVLYCGSPCQIAGLKAFLGKDYENLYTLDLICHGTPSQKLFSKYIEWLGKKFGGKIIYYGFRDKDISGWSCGGIAIAKTKTKTIEGNCDPYYASFLRGETYKESCYSCKFANMERVGDITIGDFWGVNKYYPNVDKKKGVSCCLINTKNGDELFESVKEYFEFFEISENEVREKNTNLYKPANRPTIRNHIYEEIDSFESIEFFKKFQCKKSIFIKMKRFCLRLIPTPIKKILKRLIISMS